MRLPLPLDVAATLTKLVGVAYPNAQMSAIGGGSDTVFMIDAADRVPDGDLDAYLGDFTPNRLDPGVGPSTVGETDMAPPEWLASVIGDAVSEFLADAPNCKQFGFTRGNQDQMVPTVARSEGQAPHELRMQAEERVTTLEAKLTELGVDPDTV